MNVKISRKWLLSLSFTLGTLILLWVISTALAEGPEGGVRPQGDVSAAATVNSRISYQGVLKENGVPVTGYRDMTFRFYSNDTCSIQVGYNIVRDDVPVTEGLFSVELDVDQNAFNGQGLWLEVEVNGTYLSCEEVLPVPYALSLRPGAVIEGGPTGWEGGVLSVNMTGFYPLGKAVWASTATGSAVRGNSTSGYGLYGYSEQGYAVYGEDAGTETARGYGGYFSSANGIGVYGYSGAPIWHNNPYAPAIYGRSENGMGVYGVSESSLWRMAGVYGQASTGSAVRGESDDGTGLYGYSHNNYAIRGESDNSWGGYFTSSGGYGIRVNTDGNNHWDHAGYFTADWGNGIYVTSAHGNALRAVGGDDLMGVSKPGGTVGVAGLSGSQEGVFGSSRESNGVYGVSQNSSGVWGSSDHSHGVYGWSHGSATDQGYGGYFRSSNYRGLYAKGGNGWYAGYFDGQIRADGYVSQLATRTVVVNGGDEVLEPGDVVAIAGVVESPNGGELMLAVRRADASNGAAVVGVVVQAMRVEMREIEKGINSLDVQPMEGKIMPQDYLAIVTSGLVPAVKVNIPPGGLEIGEMLTVSAVPGAARKATLGPESDGAILGKVAGPVDAETGTVPVFVILR